MPEPSVVNDPRPQTEGVPVHAWRVVARWDDETGCWLSLVGIRLFELADARVRVSRERWERTTCGDVLTLPVDQGAWSAVGYEVGLEGVQSVDLARVSP